jgi:hypothetical protein
MAQPTNPEFKLEVWRPWGSACTLSSEPCHAELTRRDWSQMKGQDWTQPPLERGSEEMREMVRGKECSERQGTDGGTRSSQCGLGVVREEEKPRTG